MCEAGLAVVERDPAVESLIELNLGSGEGEAPCLGRDLEAAALPLHDIVVADDAFMPERTDAIQIVRRGTPGFGDIARSAREAPVVVSDELAQDTVGGVEITRMGKAKFAAQAILKNTPKAFDAAFGLRRLRGEAFDRLELFREVMVVEAEVAGARQVQDALTQVSREATGAGPPATGVCHRRLTALPIARFEAFHLSRR